MLRKFIFEFHKFNEYTGEFHQRAYFWLQIFIGFGEDCCFNNCFTSTSAASLSYQNIRRTKTKIRVSRKTKIQIQSKTKLYIQSNESPTGVRSEENKKRG